MTREDRRIARNMTIAVALSLVGMWIVAEIGAWLRPVDPKYAHCLRRTLVEYRQCLLDAEAKE